MKRKLEQHVVDPILKKISEYTGTLFMYFYNDKVRELKNDIVNLGHVKQRVQESVNKDERNGNVIYDDVKKWLEKVDDITAKVSNLPDNPSQEEQSCSTLSFQNLKSRHQSSRKVIEMAQDVSKLEGEGSAFEGRGVSFRVAPQGIGTEPVKGYEVFESRNKTLSGVIEALKRDNVSKIGVYGMGGVGKTMLVKEVARQAMEDKLFDKVVILIVSQTPNVKEIQDKIAYVLDLKFEEESTRADKLRERLKIEKSMLVIIDDIWEELDLEAVGISFGDGQKGCKLLFTSISKGVLCNEMGCQKFFGLEDLLNDEARNLFGKIVGGLPEDIEFRSVADDVVKECAGLPIAITTVANALKNKRLPIWKDVVHQLRTSNPTNIKGVPEKVYSSIELSYNFLSKEAKPFFLLCSLFGEYSEIPFELLLRCAMGLDLFQDVYHLEEVRNRVHTVVENLKSSSLLLDGDKDDTVKMHDVIHDVAIHIAGKAEHMFIVENAVKLQELSKQKKLKDSTALSMLYTGENVCEFLARSECSRLKLLLFFGKSSSLQIPHPFFEGMKELRVLNLDGIDSQYLSSSISLLKNLQTLCLNHSKLENIALIGQLENLKVLSLSESGIKELPKEISQLTNLQVLDLSDCSKLKIIPANVLLNLKRLEELDMANSFTSWEVEGESTKGSIARVTELDHLSQLTTLNIHIPSANFLPKALIFKKLVRYKICIGDDDDDVVDDDDWDASDIKFKTPRTLVIFKWSLQLENLNAAKILLKSCEDLHLVKFKGFQNIFYELSLDGFQRLKHLQVAHNDEFQFIIKGHQCLAFPALESFLLFNMINLEKICHGQLAVGSFHNLREVRVRKCENLKFVFSSSMAGCFPQLQEMKIIECKVMSTIIAMEREDETEIIDGMKDMIEFTQLKSLTLEDLPNLKCFHSDVDSRLLFNEKVSFKNLIEFPSLKTLKIADCPELKTFVSNSLSANLTVNKELEEMNNCALQPFFNEKVEFPERQKLHLTSLVNFEEIWQGLLPAKAFPKLSEMIVDTCGKLLYVMPFNSLPSFESLEKLTVQKCRSLKEVFHLEEPNNMVEPLAESTVLPKLSELVLTQLPKLVHIFNKDFAAKISVLQNLEVLKVKDCDCLKNLFSPSIAKCLEHIKEVEISNCRDMEEIFVKEKVGEINETISFTHLNSIVLENLPSLQTLCSGSISFGNLTSLQVIHCNELEKLFSPSTAKNLEQLKLLKLYGCKKMKEVISDENGDVKDVLFPELNCLILKHLPILTSFCSLEISFKCDSLEMVRVKEIPKMKTFARGIQTPKLKAIYVTHIGKCWLGDLNASIKQLYDKNATKSSEYNGEVQHGKAKQTVVDESSSKGSTSTSHEITPEPSGATSLEIVQASTSTSHEITPEPSGATSLEIVQMSSVGDTAAVVAQFLLNKVLVSLGEPESELSAWSLISYIQNIIDTKMETLELICSSDATKIRTLDLLYDLNYLLAECRIFTNGLKKLHQSLSHLIPLKKFLFRKKVKQRLSRIGKGFEEVVKEAGKKMVEEPKGRSVQSGYFDTVRHTSSRVNESEIFQFDTDVEKDVESLLRRKRDDDIGFTAIGIVGMGGVGKTALVQKIFNSPLDRVQKEFTKKIWICLSDVVDKEKDVEVKIVKCILDGLGGDTDEDTKTTDFGIVELLEKLKRYLSGERYLIVLDDVWHTHNLFNFEYLGERKEECLWHWLPKDCYGAVIVTSRKKEVAEYMVGVGEKNLVHLKPSFCKESCWKIFYNTLRKDGRIISGHPTLDKINNEIMDQCHGLPLAAQNLAKLIPKKIAVVNRLEAQLADTKAQITQLEQRCAYAEHLVTCQQAQISSLTKLLVTTNNSVLQGMLSRVPHFGEARAETVDSSDSYMDWVAVLPPQQPGTTFDVLEGGSSGGGAFAYSAHHDDPQMPAQTVQIPPSDVAVVADLASQPLTGPPADLIDPADPMRDSAPPS